jgi:hypothetical protein
MKTNKDFICSQCGEVIKRYYATVFDCTINGRNITHFNLSDCTIKLDDLSWCDSVCYIEKSKLKNEVD